MADATAAFNARDAGGAGRLAPAEMRAALAAFGVELSDAEHTLLFPPPPAGDAAAAGGDAAAATVDYAEFVRHYRCRPPPARAAGNTNAAASCGDERRWTERLSRSRT